MTDSSNGQLVEIDQCPDQGTDQGYLEILMDDLMSTYGSKAIVLAMSKISERNFAVAQDMNWDVDCESLLICWQRLSN